MSYYSLVDFFKDVNNAPTDEDRKRILAGASKWQKMYLYEAFADWDWMNLPEGKPPFNALDGDKDIAPTKLCTPYATRQLVKFHNDHLTQFKRETQFIQLLEGLGEEEAELLCIIKDKQTEEHYPNFTRALVNEVFPDLLIQKEEPNA